MASTGEARERQNLVNAEHIGRHDPACVLRAVDAKRAVIDAVFVYESKIDDEWGCSCSAERIAAGECSSTHPDEIPALRLLAAEYAGSPGYREEWRP